MERRLGYDEIKTLLFKLICFFLAIIIFDSCSSNIEAKPVNEDSVINALNAADTVPKIPQKITDSINKAYLDSLKKNVDTNNAEYGTGHE